MQTRHFSAVRFRPVSFLGLFCALGLAWLALPTREVRAQQEPPAKTSLPVLTRAEQIRNLTPDQAGLGYPVRLRAVITYCDLSHGDLFVEDATGSIYVDPSELKAVLHSGQYVEVEGTSDAGDFSSEVTKPRITILGEAPIPRPQKITAEELVSGNHDTRWVEVEGVARSVIDDEGRLRLNLASGAARFDAYVLDHPSAPPALVGAKIRLRGVSSGVYTVSNEYIGAALMVPSLTDLHILGHGPADLFSLPVRPIHFLLRSHPEGAFNRPVRLQGVVTLQRLGQVLYVHDGKNAVQVNTRQMTPLGIGDLIDVVGFPALGEYTPILEEAIFRRIGAGRVPPPVTTTASQLLLGAQNGELVRISGRLIGHAIQSGQVSLELVEGEFTFKAGIEDPKGRVALASLRDGSYVQLTGICSVEADYTRRPHSFSILLRSPEDIVVLRSPSWWTLKRMLWAVGVMAGLILAALAWAVLLRRRVDEQTATIREQLRREAALKERYHELFENANDVVFTCGLRGHLTSLNKAGQRITGYSLPEAVGKNLTQMVAPEYSALAQQIIQRDRAQEGPTIHELEIVTKDGRRVLLEVSIRFICDEGLPVAIQGIARDITERKRAEEALRESEERFRGLFQGAAEGILVSNFETQKFVYANPAVCRMLGYTEEELVHMGVSDLHPQQDLEWVVAGFMAQTRGEKTLASAIPCLCKDGTTIYADVNASRLVLDGKDCCVAFFTDITARKRAEEALRRSEERSRIVAASISDLIYEWDLKDKIDWYGDVDSLMGYPAGGFPRTLNGWAAALHPEDKERVWVAVEDQLKGVAPYDVEEYRIAEKDGGWRWWSARGTVLRDEQGQPRGWIGAVTDITERKRAEETLRESEERFRGLFQGAAEGILLADVETKKFVYANPAVCRMLGYTEEELVHLGVSDIHPQQDLEWVVADFMAQARGEKALASAVPCLRKDGTTIYADVNASGLMVDGKDCSVGFFTDITERRRAEQTQVRLVAILDATPDFVGFADARDGHIFYINPAGRKMVGVGAQEDVTRLKMADVHPEWTNKLFRDEIIPTAIRDGVWTGECAFLHRDGREIPVLMVLLAHKSPSGEVERFSTVSRDITERQRAERELQKAKEAADAASRAKSEFLANMSHEIRTPMNGIIGMTELALDTELTPEQREYLVMVKDSADILLTLINDILDFSKIEAGKLGLDLVEFNLHDTLGNTMKTLAPRASGKGLELVYQTPPRLPRDLVGDPGRLRQILVNLVGNAIKFTEQGEVAVHVETESQTQDGVELHFAVTDTGIGIPREMQELIFAAFAQADASTTRKYGGTGLGLAITSQLVKMMRGRLWVDSEPGQGSTFHFTAHFGLAQAPTKPHALRETVCLRDMPVLVVDDNATNRRILEAMLTHWLMQPTLADGGWAGLAAMEQAKDAERPFPLVLIDAQMPDMDGFTLARRIKESPGLAGATIMMLASAGQRGDAARCRELGIAAYLIKPIRQSELLEAILVALGRPSREGERPTVLTRHSLREARRKLRVLVAEDNVVNRELAVRLLEKHGHTVAVAGNGRETLEALEKATSRGFDVVLMDVQMPEMDGLEATAAIRQKEKATGRHLPIIAMTAHALKGDRERCLAAGMDDYLAKPIQAKELLAAVEGAVLPAVETRESVPAEPRPEEILDRVTALARVDGDAKLLGELAGLFLADTARLLSAVRQAVTRGDAKALEYAAHALKSSVGNFSAHAAFEAAARLEMSGRQGDLAEAQEAYAVLQQEIERLKPVLEGFAKGGSK